MDAGLYCGPRLRKGEVFAYVGLPHNLKDLKYGGLDLPPDQRVLLLRERLVEVLRLRWHSGLRVWGLGCGALGFGFKV